MSGLSKPTALGRWVCLTDEDAGLVPMASREALRAPEVAASSSSALSVSATPSLWNLRGPTREQLSALFAVPAAIHATAQRHAGGGKGGKKNGKKTKLSPLAIDGKIYARLFDARGSRPTPWFSSLEQTITITLETQSVVAQSSLTVPVYGAFYFTVSDYPAATQLIQVFDQYKIEQVECWLTSELLTETVKIAPMSSCIDLDDANVPVSNSDVCDRQGALAGSVLDGRYHKWRPHIAVAEFSGTFTSYGNVVAGWIDVASPNVQHYGLKYSIPDTDGAARPILLTRRAVVSFRGPSI